jgi:hypothetical protein
MEGSGQKRERFIGTGDPLSNMQTNRETGFVNQIILIGLLFVAVMLLTCAISTGLIGATTSTQTIHVVEKQYVGGNPFISEIVR